MDFATVFGAVFTWPTMGAMAAGVVGGIVMGALPGLSATMAVALMVPMTFGMQPISAMVMLSACYTAAIYGGSITAILIHTPGTPASAATAIDGYAMTKRGEGLKAIGISTISSMFGGTVSGLGLLFIAPPLALISLKFSAPEYFFLAVFGLTIIGSLAGESMVKGLMSGLFGLMVGVVGLDYMTGIPRFTFGSMTLEGGITMVPAMIGMFSISQVMISAEEMARGKTTILEDPATVLKGKILPAWTEFRRMAPIAARCSLIGMLVGILPGAGGDIGSWIGYNEAKRISRHRDEFGRGSIEGITASEVANNAVTGGALIPLLTLGIPGSGTAAILLGGLMIHGLIPGHQLFTRQAHITYPIMVGFLIANLAMGAIGLLIARPVTRVSKVPMAVLAPLIISLSTIGSYAINISIFEVYLMAVFGLIGYFMRKNGFATAPTVLGVILGPMVENNFRRSLVLARGQNILGYYMSRPICLVLFALIIAVLFLPGIVNRVKARMNRDLGESDPETSA